MHKSHVLIALMCATVLTGCVGKNADDAFKDARVQLGMAKAGFTPRRDSLELLRYAASNATNDEDKARYNMVLAKNLEKNGFKKESYSAYERAALAGDLNGASHVAKAHADGEYKPTDLAALGPMYLQLIAEGKSESSILLLADLTARGELKGPEYKTSSYWINLSASRGNKKAIGMLADAAEARGDIAAAAAYYKRVDNGMAPGERSIRQARDNYLGMGREKNAKVGRAWLALASKEDKKGAAQLAARIYRETNGEVDAPFLEKVALAAGIQNLQVSTFGRAKIIEGYKAAKSDSERDALLAPLRKAAENGNTSTAFFFAGILQAVGKRDEALKYYLISVKGGMKEAVQPVTEMVTLLNEKDPATGEAVAVLETVAKGGNVQAAKVLGTLYGVGGPVKADVAKSLEWLKIAADGGDVDAQYRFGVLSIGRATNDSDKQIAKAYIMKAADAGNAGAKAYISSLSN